MGIGAAIAYFTSRGDNVLLPITDSQDYDIVVDIDGILHKVQVKYTSAKSPYGKYVVSLRSISGSSRKEYKTVRDTSVDYLFILTEIGDRYLMPISELKSVSTLNISDEFHNKYHLN